MYIGVTNSTTIARKSISLAPGSLSEAVCASEFFQCQILSTALNGNIATRHTRAPYQTSGSNLTIESTTGFLIRLSRATLGHAPWCHHRPHRRRSPPPGRDRRVPQKHAWRAEIVLLTADGLGTVEIMRRTGKSKTCVWRWQERFAAEGVDGLLRDKTRPPRVPPLGQEVTDQVVALTATEPPHEATHWTGAAMAKAAGVSVSSVQRIWRAHGLAPH